MEDWPSAWIAFCHSLAFRATYQGGCDTAMIQFLPDLGALLLGPLYIVEHADYIDDFH